METHGLKVVEYFAVVRIYFLRIFSQLFLICVAAERKSFFMDVHSDINCAIIHFDDLHLYAVIPVTLIVTICSIQVNPRFCKSEVITYYLILLGIG